MDRVHGWSPARTRPGAVKSRPRKDLGVGHSKLPIWTFINLSSVVLDDGYAPLPSISVEIPVNACGVINTRSDSPTVLLSS